jgi:hypothetical protein
MRTLTTRTVLAFAAVALISAAVPLRAQESKTAPPQEKTAPAQERTAQGQLMRVDTEAMTLSIQSSQGSPQVFRYTSATKVTGADKGVAGLATMSGASVTVQYVQQNKDNVATQIDIRPKQ